MHRICNSVERLAEVIEEVNGELDEAESSYANIDKAHSVWRLYETKMAQVLKGHSGP